MEREHVLRMSKINNSTNINWPESPTIAPQPTLYFLLHH
jgi:hypothetical protein